MLIFTCYSFEEDMTKYYTTVSVDTLENMGRDLYKFLQFLDNCKNAIIAHDLMENFRPFNNTFKACKQSKKKFPCRQHEYTQLKSHVNGLSKDIDRACKIIKQAKLEGSNLTTDSERDKEQFIKYLTSIRNTLTTFVGQN